MTAAQSPQNNQNTPSGKAASTTITLALDPRLATLLETVRKRERQQASTEDFVRHILDSWLTENSHHGRLRDEGRRPDDLNSTNDG